MDLDFEDLKNIFSNPNELKVRLTRKFDSQTNTLVDILTGKNTTFWTKVRKFRTPFSVKQ